MDAPVDWLIYPVDKFRSALFVKYTCPENVVDIKLLLPDRDVGCVMSFDQASKFRLSI
jgi:hypothetical protein